MNTKEELLKFVSEVNDGIIFIDQKGEFTFFNEGWLELIQYSKVELENKKIVDFIHPLDQEQFNELIKSLLINEELDLFVLRVVTKHKAVRFVQFYVKGVYEGDNYIGARFIASDVTIREFSRRYRKAEHTLMQEIALGSTHNDIRETVGNLMIGLFESQFIELDKYGFMVFEFEFNSVNRSTQYIHKTNGNPLFDEVQTSFSNFFNKIEGFKNNELDDIKRFVLQATSQFDLEIVFYPIKNKYDELVGLIFFIGSKDEIISVLFDSIQDIGRILTLSHEQARLAHIRLQRKKKLESLVHLRTKELEEEIVVKEEKERLLQLSEQYFRKTFEDALHGIAIINPDHKIEDINIAFAKITGYNRDELFNKPFTDLIEKEHVKDDLNMLDQLLIGATQGYEHEERYVRKNNQKIWVLSSVTLMKDSQGNALNILLQIIDITEKKKAEEEILKAKDEAEKLNASKTEFLANMSHEIRSPLNAIIGFSHVVKKMIAKKENVSKITNYIDNIELSGKNLASIINDILDLSKIEAGKHELSEDWFSPEQVVKNAYNICKAQATEKALNYSYHIPEKLPERIFGDNTKLTQILLNLVGNAIKFTSKEKKVEIHALMNDDELILSVVDEGIGIDEKNLDSIFNPFEQEDTSTTRNYGGTGLGLSITKSLVELMNGQLLVESKKGKGSTFKVIVPFHKIQLGKSSYDEQKNDYHSCFNGIKILVVDDTEINHEVLKGVFEDFEVNLFHAYNGNQCKEIAERELPDIILMDFHMPDIDGSEVTRNLKQSNLTKKIPVIGVSADAFKSSKEAALSSGMEGYITKPIDFDQLFLTMSKILPKDLIENTDIQQDSKVDADTKELILLKIAELKQYEIYETEKLMENILNIESSLLNASNNALLNNQILDLKGAILSGDEMKMSEISDEISKLINL